MRLFGVEVDPADLPALVPEVTRLAGIRQFREENGAGSGQRVIRIESGGGLSVELLPDRCCDIGMVWCGGVPFGWAGPMGAGHVPALGGNAPLSGLMTTCGFDHIRQPVTDEGRAYPLHGSMQNRPATILAAMAEGQGAGTVFRVVAEVHQFALDRGTVRLRRTIEVPLGGHGLTLEDEVTVLAGALPLMAMYHVNLGFPLAGPDSRLELSGADVTDTLIATDGIRTLPAGNGTARIGPAGGPSMTLGWDAAALPVFQALRDGRPGINLTCLEPATHERLDRAELRRTGQLPVTGTGGSRRFRLEFGFRA